MKRLIVLLFFIAFSVTAAAQTPTPSFLMAGIYNQDSADIGISGDYTLIYDSSYYLGDAYSLPYFVYSADITTGGTAIGDMTVGDGLAAAFDDSPATYAQKSGTSPATIGYDFGVAKSIFGYTLQETTSVGATGMARDWTLQYSSDNAVWNTADTRSSQTGWADGEVRTYDVTGVYSARYWRLNISANNGGVNMHVGEIEMMEITLNSPSLSFYFYGKEFSLLSETSPNGPELEVCIDSICNNVSQYSAATTRGVSQTFSNLPEGIHSVTISRLTSGGANAFIFDGLIISPLYDNDSSSISISVTLQPPATEASRYAWEIDNELGTPQAVVFDYSANAGDMFVGSSIYAVLLMLMMLFVVILWGVLRWQKR